ncbi:hypothetical protein M758_1G326700 [Ceratodon purpureus]|nr:hypothetical protein M758_1G326700 [Ceratodon purpureus]
MLRVCFPRIARATRLSALLAECSRWELAFSLLWCSRDLSVSDCGTGVWASLWTTAARLLVSRRRCEDQGFQKLCDFPFAGKRGICFSRSQCGRGELHKVMDMETAAWRSPRAGVILLFVALISVVSSVHGQQNQQEINGLIAMYNDFSQNPKLTGWTQNNANPCGGQNWLGIVCSGQTVTEIRLGGQNLNGKLSGWYLSQNLKNLRVIDVSGNNLTGDMPQQFPSTLTQMIMNNNQFTGSLPQFDNLGALTTINLSNNKLTGNLNPQIFTLLVNAVTFDVSNNQIQGSLPDSVKNMKSLKTMNLQNNQLSGQLPGSLAQLTGLDTFNIENNKFTGFLPSGFNPPVYKVGGNQLSLNAPPPPPGTPALTPRTSSGAGNGSSSSSSSFPIGAIIGVAVGGVVILAVLGLVFWFCCKKKRAGRKMDDAEANRNSSRRTWFTPLITGKDKAPKHRVFEPAPLDKTPVMEEPRVKASPPVKTLKAPPSFKGISGTTYPKVSGTVNRNNIAATAFSVADLQAATNSFSQDNLIGEGGLGRVYRAEFPNGQVLAVKKIDSNASMVQNEDDFLSVVDGLSRLQQTNCAELVGYCVEHDQRLLVYEYISRGTLNELLHFSGENTKGLSWNVRIKIALGAARALEYLHEVCAPPVVHRNFKSGNILLDDELNAHVSDCGLANLAPSGSERQVSAQMLGSFGYSAPEYAMSGTYTVKSDVYSFGVVMLELLTGRKPLDSTRPRSEQSLVRWATPQLHDIDALARMVDPALKGIYPAKSLSRFADIVALCVQPEPEFRPPMSEVVQALVRLMQRASLSKRRSESATGMEVNEPSDSL